MRRSLSALIAAALVAGCAHDPAPPRPPQTPEEAQLDPRGGDSPWPLVGVGAVGLGIVAITMLSGMAFFVAK